MSSVLCFDLGASTGRAIIVTKLNKQLKLEEIHRFSTNIIENNNIYFWDFQHILKQIKIGIKKAVEKDKNIKSIGFDTWGCDYGWIDDKGKLLENPRSYRTGISNKIIDEVHKKISFEKHYKICGNGYFNFNTIYQIYYDVKKKNILKKGAKQFLFIPNLIFYYLTGKKLWEYTIASTSGLLDASTRKWSDYIFETLEIPKNIKGEISYPKDIFFPLKDSICKELKLEKNLNVTLVAGHDTACAVIGASLKHNSAYLINGTWSLLGVENDKAITDLIGIKNGIVNEGGLNKKIRFMSMMIGTSIFQKLKKDWSNQKILMSFEEFSSLARKSDIKDEIEIDSDFLYPKNMENLIKQKYFEKYSRNLEDKKDILKLVYNSLGKKYKSSLELIESLIEKDITNIILLGGGNKDKMLVETIKKYIDKKIIIGPVESSVIGNAFVQFLTLEQINNTKKI